MYEFFFEICTYTYIKTGNLFLWKNDCSNFILLKILNNDIFF